jgi:hypothetical protein
MKQAAVPRTAARFLSRVMNYFADFFVNAVMSGMPAERAASTIATTVP